MSQKIAVEYDSKAFREGYSAGLSGAFREDNPYPSGRHSPTGDTRSLSWISGLIEGKAEREAARREGRPMRVYQARPVRCGE